MSFVNGFNAATRRAEVQEKIRTNREQQKERKKVMDLQLLEKGYTPNSNGGFNVVQGGQADLQQQQRDLQQQQISMQNEAINSLNGKLAADATDGAIEEFMASGDASVFQNAMDNNEFLRNAWAERGVQVVNNIDFDNDQALLEQAGVTADYINDAKSKEQLKKNLWKYYDGKKWNIGMLDSLVSETGVLRRTSNRKANTIMEHMGALKSAMSGVNIGLEQDKLKIKQFEAETVREQTSINASNAVTDRMKAQRKGAREDQKLSLDAAELDFKYKKLAHDMSSDRGSTTKIKNLNFAERRTESLVNNFGSEEEFFNTDFSDQDNYRKAYKDVQAIESTLGIEFSSAEEKKLNNVRKLIAISDPASKLSKSQTGMIDNLLGNTKKYVDDSLTGDAAKSAYNAFRNTVRHSLFGSALTASEIKSFNEAFGHLGQKIGPVLTQFKTNLNQVKSDLDSISRNNNPYIAKVRLGVDQQKLDDIIGGIDERLDYLSGRHKVDEVNKKPVRKLTPKDMEVLRNLKRSLENK